jgi:hypothetical protein
MLADGDRSVMIEVPHSSSVGAVQQRDVNACKWLIMACSCEISGECPSNPRSYGPDQFGAT